MTLYRTHLVGIDPVGRSGLPKFQLDACHTRKLNVWWGKCQHRLRAEKPDLLELTANSRTHKFKTNMPSSSATLWREYVPFWNPKSTLPIRETSFQHYTVSTRRGAVNCQSMLSSLELAYLHFLAKDRFSGAGAIVDLGPFCGVGTLAMASGLAHNPSGHMGRIYSFDLFLTNEYDWFFDDWKLNEFGSVFPLFTRITEDYRDQIAAIPGDLLKNAMEYETHRDSLCRYCEVARIESVGSL